MRLPQQPTPASPRLASGLSSRVASSLLAALLATGAWHPCLPPAPAAAAVALPSTMKEASFWGLSPNEPSAANRAEVAAAASKEVRAAAAAVAAAQVEADAAEAAAESVRAAAEAVASAKLERLAAREAVERVQAEADAFARQVARPDRPAEVRSANPDSNPEPSPGPTLTPSLALALPYPWP